MFATLTQGHDLGIFMLAISLSAVVIALILAHAVR